MKKKPNIIIINPDEMRVDSLGHLGNRAAHTPRLDAFAMADAVSFANAFCQNPVCVPSRCSFMTGLYPHTRGHRTMGHLLHSEETTLLRELKEAGYYVWMNKMNDLVAAQDSALIDKHVDELFYANTKASGSTLDLSAMGSASQAGSEEKIYSHYTGVREVVGDGDMVDTLAACERIKTPIPSDKPLCMFLGLGNPHVPYVTEQKYFDTIQKEALGERVRYEDTEGKSLMMQKLHEYTDLGELTEEKWNMLRAVYLGKCAQVDEMFGMVCDALKEAGEYDNSAIFFLSDHGDFTGDFGLPEKAQNCFEHCLTRVPLMIKPPRGEAVDAGVTQSLAELVDFYATVMDYAGVAPNHNQFGRSLRTVIAYRKAPGRPYVFSEGGRNPGELQCDEWHAAGPDGPARSNPYWPKMTAQKDDDAHAKATMIFDGRYKYVRRSRGQDEFYDLRQDPQEKKNIIAMADREKLGELRMAMLNWYQITCDVVPRERDRRISNEFIWSKCCTYCPEDKVDQVKAFIANGADLGEAIYYCIGLLLEQSKSKI